MPRFFFNIRNPDGEDVIDAEGMELPDIEAARLKAEELGRALLEVEAAIQKGRKLN
jgi:hypothetical protein